LQPFMASRDKFMNKKNHAEIEKHLQNLVNAAKTLEENHRLKTPGFRVSAEQINEHLAFTLSVFKTGDKKFAHRMLKASLGGCSSCHQQAARRTKALWPIADSELKG